MLKFKTIFFLLSLFSASCYSQDCSKAHNWPECDNSYNSSYELYQQPRMTTIGVNDKMGFNIVFYGNKDFIISVCADQKYYPLSIKFINPATGKVLYNNVLDEYREIITMRFDNTQNVILLTSLMADKHDKERLLSSEKACVGVIVQWKDVVQKKQQKIAR